MKTRTNAQRAADARITCADYEIVRDGDPSGDPQTGLVDLLTDALHAGLKVDDALRLARAHYETEKA